MTIEMMIDEETGEVKPFTRKNAKHSAKPQTLPEHGDEEASSRKKRKGKTASPDPAGKTYAKVALFLAKHVGHLAYQAGCIMAEGPDGWVDVTDEIICDAHRAVGGNAHPSFLPILRDLLKVPEAAKGPRASLYHERVTDRLGKSKWIPFKVTKNQVVLTDGIYDIRTDVREPFNGRVIFGPRVSMPWIVEGDEEPARCIEFEEMVERAFPDAEIRRHFQEVVSMILQPHVLHRGQVILWGPPGSGKTTLATAIGCSVAGASGVSFTQEADLVHNKWSRAGLLNKFVNISDDSPVVTGWPGFLKSYTAGNLHVEVKFGQPYRAPATAKLISTCNELQDSVDASGAMVDRMIPFHMARRIETAWDHDMMQVEYWCDPDRRAGIVNWLLDGLIRMNDRGRLDPPKSWENEKLVAVGLADPLEAWLRDNIKVDKEPEARILKSDLFSKIPSEILPSRSVDTKMASYMERLFKSSLARLRVDGEREKVFVGVTWK